LLPLAHQARSNSANAHDRQEQIPNRRVFAREGQASLMNSIRISRFATSAPAGAPFSNGRLWPIAVVRHGSVYEACCSHGKQGFANALQVTMPRQG